MQDFPSATGSILTRIRASYTNQRLLICLSIFVTGSIVLQGLTKTGVYQCESLLSKGIFKSDRWVSSSCLIKQYSVQDFKTCFQNGNSNLEIGGPIEILKEFVEFIPGSTNLGDNAYDTDWGLHFVFHPDAVDKSSAEFMIFPEIDSKTCLLTKTPPNEYSYLNSIANSYLPVQDCVQVKYRQMVNTFLQVRCNPLLFTWADHVTTCCIDAPQSSPVTLVLLGIFGLVIIMLYWKTTNNRDPSDTRLSSKLLFRFSDLETNHLLVIFIALLFSWVSDRTSTFSTTNKYFDLPSVVCILISSIVYGFTTIQTNTDDSFLNRYQTNEWKGWMQIVILVYHYFGGSKIPFFYNSVRVLVGMYLFMTGYGHFSYFYLKSDYSIGRFMQTLVRLNFLSIVLSFTMDKSLLDYYFGPMVSYWFIVVYSTMAFMSGHNRNTRFLIGKICVAIIISTVFVSNSVFLDSIFSVLNKYVRTRWDAREFRFRLALDQFIVFAGMLVSLSVILFRENFKLLEDSKRRRLVIYAVTSSLAVLLAYCLIAFVCTVKTTYTSLHAFVSVPVIIAYVIVRNSTEYLRSRSIPYFEWIGCFSLETFVLQYHIWLNFDAVGTLVIFPASELVNFVVCTTLFVFISEATAAASVYIVKTVVPKDFWSGVYISVSFLGVGLFINYL